jgi:uncharacterized membrane protein YdbT with pleckstrin-like domain
MSYIDRHLLDGEQIVFRTRLHWVLMLWPLLLGALVFLPISGWLLSGQWRVYAWIPIAAALLVLLPAYIRRRSSDFAVTNKRVMMKLGVLDTRSVELLLGKVESITVEQSLTGRILGFGDIVVCGSGGTKEPFSHIQSPMEFRRAVQSVTDAQSGIQPAPPPVGRS